MADNSSRSLLAPYGEYSKTPSAWTGKRSTYKTPAVILSLFATLIICIVTSVTILIKSHEDPVASWNVQPSVLLAFLSGIYLLALGALFTTGVAVTWWRAIVHGSTLRRLHYTSVGANPLDFVSALLAGNEARRVALAALVVFAVKLSVGPLIQRSTRARLHEFTNNVEMNIHLASEIPDRWFGNWGQPDSRGLLMAQGTFLNSTISTHDSHGFRCAGTGTCSGVVAAAGINFGCTTTTETIDLLDSKNANSSIFSIDLERDFKLGQPMLFLTTKYVESINDDCAASLRTEVCNIIPATVWYPITKQGTTLTLNLASFLDQPNIKSNYTSAADSENKDPAAPIGPLEGAFRAFASTFGSQLLLTQDSNGNAGYKSSVDLPRGAYWPNLFFDASINAPESSFPTRVQGKCPLVWKKPSMPLIGHIYEFMFRAASASASGDEKNTQSFAATYRDTEFRYATDFPWLAAAIVIMAIGNAAAMSLLWGWWQLDHFVSLSPLETGKAFGAPIFTKAGPEQEANGILKEVGNERVAHDGDELIWSGSVYATGATHLGSQKGSTRETENMSGHSSMRGRGHRRGMSSVSGASDTRPSFEHSLGYTTRRPYDDEEEADMGFVRQRSRSVSRAPSVREPDTAGLMAGLVPLPLTLAPGRPPPIPQVEPLSPGRRGRSASTSGIGNGKRPLSLIPERNSPVS